MTRTIVAALAAALALAGCGGASDDAESVPNAAAGEPDAGNDAAAEANAIGNDIGDGNVLATVLAMPEGRRNIVFVRAIMDANLPCEGVLKSERMPDQDGKPLWRAECKTGDSHLISITPDGTANIISRASR